MLSFGCMEKILAYRDKTEDFWLVLGMLIFQKRSVLKEYIFPGVNFAFW